MKNRIVFEPGDFDGSGQMIIRNSFPVGNDDLLFASTVAYKIGYSVFKLNKKLMPVVLMISLADGGTCVYDTRDDLCKRLNEDSYGYRPMTKEEISAILGNQGNRFSRGLNELIKKGK